eukprot:jgi/Chlat1/8406/Chrsp80S09223
MYAFHRYMLSRLDRRFSKRHWIDEQRVQVKRRTELGGTYSMASYIFIVGIIGGLVLDQIVQTKIVTDQIEAADRDTLQQFVVDYSLNITVYGDIIPEQVQLLATFGDGRNDTAEFLSAGVQFSSGLYSGLLALNFSCIGCTIFSDLILLEYNFTDAAGRPPAMVAGYDYSYCTSSTTSSKQTSCSRGTILASSNGTNPSNSSQLLTTLSSFRGLEPTTMNLRQVPVKYKLVGGEAKLFQVRYSTTDYGNTVETPAEVLSASGVSRLIVNILPSTDWVLTRKIVSKFAPLTFLAAVGGVYSVSMSLFNFLLKQTELRVRYFRYDDKLLNKLEKGRLALENWKKLIIKLNEAQALKMSRNFRIDGSQVPDALRAMMKQRHHQRELERAEALRHGRLHITGAVAVKPDFLSADRATVHAGGFHAPHLLHAPFGAAHHHPHHAEAASSQAKLSRKITEGAEEGHDVEMGVEVTSQAAPQLAGKADLEVSKPRSAFQRMLEFLHVRRRPPPVDQVAENGTEVTLVETAAPAGIPPLELTLSEDMTSGSVSNMMFEMQRILAGTPPAVTAQDDDEDEDGELFQPIQAPQTREDMVGVLMNLRTELQQTQIVLSDVVSRFRPHSNM